MFATIIASKRSISHRKPVYGIGINDADYVVTITVNGRLERCPFYSVWVHMFQRCYSEKFHEYRPTYKGCSVVKEWLVFSNFREWMVGQDWEGNQLDKDILYRGNKLYSPLTCCFVSRQINGLLFDRCSAKRLLPVGVSYNKRDSKYRSLMRKNGKFTHIGSFATPESAHAEYIKAKSAYVLEVAKTQPSRVRVALLRIAGEIEKGGYYRAPQKAM